MYDVRSFRLCNRIEACAYWASFAAKRLETLGENDVLASCCDVEERELPCPERGCNRIGLFADPVHVTLHPRRTQTIARMTGQDVVMQVEDLLPARSFVELLNGNPIRAKGP